VRTYPGAASAALAPVLAGPPRPVSVVAVTPAAVYLRTGHPGCPALCLATPGAVRVPCALLVDGAPLLAGGPHDLAAPVAVPSPAPPAAVPLGAPATPATPLAGAPLGSPATPAEQLAGALNGLRVGAVGTAGRDGLTVGGLAVRVGRWWRPPRPVLGGSGLRVRTDRLPPVGELLGRGAGLTPFGDDVLAGALVALAAVGAPAAGTLAREVLAGAFARTTFVSAALLWHAARGECLPELAAFLTALAGSDRAAVAAAAGALRAVGHSSGTGMLAGATLVLAHPDLVLTGAGAAAAGGAGP
jgi:hypothetical protein